MSKGGTPAGSAVQTANAAGEPSQFQILPRKIVILTMVSVMLGIFLASMDSTIVATAMPRIAGELGGFGHYTWVTTAYLVTFTAAIPIVGKISDVHGRKWIFVAGVIVFLSGSVLCGISQNMTELILFRAFQGVGGGIIGTCCIIVVADLFPPMERGKWQGLTTGTFGLAAIVGPALGGFLTDSVSWRWVFLVNVPFGLISIFFLIFYFPKVRPPAKGQRLDTLGIAVLMLAVLPLLMALSWGGGEYPWISVPVLGSLIFSAAMGVVFLLIEQRVAHPFIPLSLFQSRIFSVSAISLFVMGFSTYAGITFIPLYFQGVLGESATRSGSFLTPMILGQVAGSVLAGQMLSRAGGHFKIQTMVGMAFVMVALAMLSRMGTHTGHTLALFNIILLGFGLGQVIPVLTIAVQNAVTYQVLGVATSTVTFIRWIGSTLGLAVAGSFMTSRFAADLSRSVTPEVKTALTPAQLSSLAHNPQAMMSPDAQTQLQSQFAHTGAQGTGLVQQLMESMRHALSSAVSDVFLMTLAAVAIGLFASFFLTELPLRGRVDATSRSSMKEKPDELVEI